MPILKTKRRLALGLLVVASIAVAVAGNSWREQQAPAAPREFRLVPAVLHQEVLDDVNAIDYYFTVENDLPVPVRIREIVRSCHCTLAGCERETIEPHDKVRLMVRYDVTSQLGTLEPRRVILKTDHPDYPQVECELRGERHWKFAAVPGSIDFGEVTRDQLATLPARPFQIRCHAATTQVDTSRATGNADWVSVELHDERLLAGGGREYDLSLTLNETAPLGKFSGQVFFPVEENDGTGPILYFHGSLLGSATARPRSLLFGLLDRNESARRVVELVATRDRSPLRILEARSANEDLRVALQNDGAWAEVELSAATFEPGEHRLSLELVCSLESQRETVQVPVLFRVTP